MRFVLLRWTPVNRAEEASARSMAAKLQGTWRTLIDWRGVLLLEAGDDTNATELSHGRGVIFGDVYAGSTKDFSSFEEGAATVAALAQERWGSYIAIVVDRVYDIVRVLRSPDGSRPCFMSRREEVEVVFTEAEDIIAMAPEIEPDLVFLAAFLTYPRVVLRRTGLSGVDELAPGEAIVFTRTTMHLESCWLPGPEPAIATFEEGARAVRSAAEVVITGAAGEDKSVLHRLSGGFDSSAVLGLLTRAMPGEQITCINEYWADAPEGDEREMARLVARAQGVRLTEFAMDPARVRYERTLNAPLEAKPSLSVLSFGDPEIANAYADIGAGLLTSGRGGDHIFHRSRSPLIAADAVRDRVADWLTIATDTARLARRSVWGVFQAMLWSGLLRQPGLVQPRSQAAALLARERPPAELSDHPWFAYAQHGTPARFARVGHLRDALAYHDRSVSSAVVAPFPVLLAQPIVEACLRIAPYIMTAGGSDRSLARAAFSDVTPPEVHSRVQKGATTRYFASVLSVNRDWIRDVLTNGELVATGVVDRARLRALLASDWNLNGRIADSMYSLVAAEAWLRNLKSRKQRAADYSAVA